MSGLIDVRRLFADYASGEISAEQLQTLEAALREDAEVRREFIEYMNVDSALGDLAALSKTEMAEIESAKHEDKSGEHIAGDSVSPASSVSEIVRTYRLAVVAGAVAATLLVATILWVAKTCRSMKTANWWHPHHPRRWQTVNLIRSGLEPMPRASNCGMDALMNWLCLTGRSAPERSLICIRPHWKKWRRQNDLPSHE